MLGACGKLILIRTGTEFVNMANQARSCRRGTCGMWMCQTTAFTGTALCIALSTVVLSYDTLNLTVTYVKSYTS